MVRELYSEEYSGNIGVLHPYHDLECSHFSYNINDFIKQDEENMVDYQSLVEIAMRSYILTDRTLIKGISRQPYLSKYNTEKQTFEYGYEIKLSDYTKYDVKQLANLLISLLKEEVVSYIKEFKKVGILLSGGMDSRILAGILRKLQIEEQLDIEVIAFNWGMENSRDRVYAEKITDLFGWEYVAFDINSQLLKENFETNLSIGCEISPINLHAMKSVRDYKNVEIILAGSYGDTLGRASYNGTKIENAPPVIFRDINRRGVIKENAIEFYKENIKKEQQSYLKYITGDINKNYIKKELDYHHSHTRRYLNTAMSLIGQDKLLFQLFTSPKVTSFLWSIPLDFRYGQLYSEVLNNMPIELRELPWSNTGKTFYHSQGKEDNYSKAHHQYGKWLRTDLKKYILELLENERLYNLEIFNERLVESKIKKWKNDSTNKVTDLDQLLSWMANFSLFLQRYDLKYEIDYNTNLTFHDYSNYLKHSIKDIAKIKISSLKKL